MILREEFPKPLYEDRELRLTVVKKLREAFNRFSMIFEVTIGSMGRGWGEDLERMVLEIFKEALEKRGSSREKLRS